DPAIIALPSWLRLPLARFIAARRTPKAMEIYAKIGGSSPILGQTEAQARALEEALGSEHEWRGYACMRYWHPMTDAVVRSVERSPLSFVSEHSETLVELDIDYRHLARDAGVPTYIRVPTVGTHPLFIHGLANLVKAALWSTTS